jgi:nucleoside-triphosphatase
MEYTIKTISRSCKNILITGLPGSGKTTLIKKLVDELHEYNPVGFFTEEIRSHGRRQGFMLKSLNEKKAGILAHVDIKGPNHVGKYGVDLLAFELFLGKLNLLDPRSGFFIIDEIGKMECLSPKFRYLVTSLLSASSPVIASIPLRTGGFIDEVKHRRDAHQIEVTARNRNKLLNDIVDLARSTLDLYTKIG